MESMVNLIDACNITTGKLDANQAVDDGQYPFFTCDPNPLSIDTFAFDCDAILLAGNNAKGNFHIQRYKGKFNAYQRTYVLTAKDGYDIDYVYYSLIISLSSFAKKAQGSQTKFLTMGILNDFKLRNLDYNQQRELVAILKSCDRKINNNNHLISELESLAKTIYDYWFLQFEFPNEEGKPYKSSGGKMIWSEDLKREIPEGWGVDELQSKVHSKRIALNPTQIPSTGKYVGLEHIPRKKVILDDYGDISTVESSKLFANDGDILFGKIRPYFHKVSITPWDVYCSSDALVLNSSNESEYAYVVFTLFSENFVRYATKAGNNGSKMPRAEWNVLKKYPIYTPPDKIMKSFNSIIHPIITQMKRIIVENKELTELRDYLLPMLMNGQVGFKE